MNDRLVLQNRLKDARKEKNYSQEELAKIVGVSRNTISSIETGQYSPTAKIALVLCIALEKKFEDIFFFDWVKDIELKWKSVQKFFHIFYNQDRGFFYSS